MLGEKAMAPHSRVLAWKIPWTEDPWGHQESDTADVAWWRRQQQLCAGVRVRENGAGTCEWALDTGPMLRAQSA